MLRRTFVAFALLAASLIPLPAPAQSAPTLVFAAASLKNALDDIVTLYAKETGKAVSVSYAASSALAKQIEQGAAAEIFISADTDWMDYVAARSLIQLPSRANLLGNRLVLVAPADVAKPVEIKQGFDMAGLVGTSRLAMGQVESVPAGKYGKAALERLGAWGALAGRVAEAESVRSALAFVARGEAAYGIVYETDAAVEPKVKVVGVFPADSYPPITYPVALTTAAKGDATAFRAFLASPAAVAVFRKYGFSLL